MGQFGRRGQSYCHCYGRWTHRCPRTHAPQPRPVTPTSSTASDALFAASLARSFAERTRCRRRGPFSGSRKYMRAPPSAAAMMMPVIRAATFGPVPSPKTALHASNQGLHRLSSLGYCTSNLGKQCHDSLAKTIAPAGGDPHLVADPRSKQPVGCKYPVTGGTSRRERLVGYHARRSWSFPASMAACVSWSACSCSSCIRATVRSSSLSFATS
jgi:hypothetical protein